MIEKHKGKSPLQRHRYSLHDDIKIDLKEAVCEGVD